MPRATFRVWLLAAATALSSASAHAQLTKAECIQANTDAQSLRRDGKLALARDELRRCSDPKCPALVSADCVKRLDELETAQPTVVFDVKDEAGRDVNDVEVKLDGRLLRASLDGAAVAVDLGEHTLTFTAPGRPSVTQRVVFREGEKSRHLVVTLAPTAGSSSAPAPVTTSSSDASPPVQAAPDRASAPTEPSASARPQRTWGYVVGGVGIAGLAVGGVFGYLAIQAKQRQTDNCVSPTECPDYGAAKQAHEAAQTSGTISTIAFIAGTAVTGLGVVLWATARPSEDRATAAELSLVPSLAPDAAQLELRGRF